jgi:hypothetical protein
MEEKVLNEEDLKKLNFAELTLYIETLNEIEKSNGEESDIDG